MCCGDTHSDRPDDGDKGKRQGSADRVYVESLYPNAKKEADDFAKWAEDSRKHDMLVGQSNPRF